MAAIQCSIRGTGDAHQYGSSITNQRIENWWSHQKKQHTSWIIDFFKAMVEDGTLVTGSDLHTNLVWYVFAEFLQKELDDVAYQWNTHYIRRSRHDTVPGIPDVLFYLPEMSGHQDMKQAIDVNTLNTILRQQNIEAEADDVMVGVQDDMYEYFNFVVNLKGLPYPPKSWEEGRFIFQNIAVDMV